MPTVGSHVTQARPCHLQARLALVNDKLKFWFLLVI